MVQFNSIFNYLNVANFFKKHKLTGNMTWIFFTKNSKFYFSGFFKKDFDNFNNSINSFKKKNYFLMNNLNILIFSFFLYQCLHMGFRGKSYRIRNFTRVNKFTFNLGYSHWTKLKLLVNWSFYKRRRQNYLIYCFFLKDFFFFKRFISKVRVYNPYTMRGLRLRKQPIIRRFGKISQHISSLH